MKQPYMLMSSNVLKAPLCLEFLTQTQCLGRLLGMLNKFLSLYCHSKTQNWCGGYKKIRALISLLWIFLILQNHALVPLNHVHIWQVSQQLSYDETIQ